VSLSGNVTRHEPRLPEPRDIRLLRTRTFIPPSPQVQGALRPSPTGTSHAWGSGNRPVPRKVNPFRPCHIPPPIAWRPPHPTTVLTLREAGCALRLRDEPRAPRPRSSSSSSSRLSRQQSVGGRQRAQDQCQQQLLQQRQQQQQHREAAAAPFGPVRRFRRGDHDGPTGARARRPRPVAAAAREPSRERGAAQLPADAGGRDPDGPLLHAVGDWPPGAAQVPCCPVSRWLKAGEAQESL
jgi:hypothetical protein